jgi:5-methylcytosine-specific restriction endonuclease McrA
MAKKSKTRQFVEERANYLCEYCKSSSRATTEPFVIEHIIAVAKGGTNVLDNLAFSCSGCNGDKYSKISGFDIETNQTVPLFHPRQEDWKNHFKWSEDATLIVGKTATGRVTVKILQLNRLPLQILRQAFIVFGIHPPK